MEECKHSWFCPDKQAVILKIEVSGLKQAKLWNMIECKYPVIDQYSLPVFDFFIPNDLLIKSQLALQLSEFQQLQEFSLCFNLQQYFSEGTKKFVIVP